MFSSSFPMSFSSSFPIRHSLSNGKPQTTRHSVNYEPSIWGDRFLDYNYDNMEKSSTRRVQKLKDEVSKELLDDMVGSFPKLEMIDAIQRLGVGYHFDKEIKTTLHRLWIKGDACLEDDLHFVALYFRLLRRHGYQVPQDVFNGIKDNKGSFRQALYKDIKGMLSFYEASHLCIEGENIMYEANAFTSNHLQFVKGNITDSNLAEKVVHALDLPLHWTMPRLESMWYIGASHREEKMNPSLLQLAKLDFNLVQATHQKELKNLSRWWKDFEFSKNLSFARDRLVESFLWSVGVAYEPQYERCREWITKFTSLTLVIDDIYDINGYLDELELFTNAVERWDNDAEGQLPDHMKLCFLALYNTTNDMAYVIFKENGQDILPYLRKLWKDFCKAMLLEAKWSNKGYTPSLKEYLANASISTATPVGLVYAFFATKQKITNDVLECLNNYDEPIQSASLIFRLCNDLATSSAELKRGDVPSAIQCYMREANTSEQVAREKIKDLISNLWKKLNKSMFESPFDHSFVNLIMNHVRTAHSIYQDGDGIGVQDHEANERVKALLITPID